MKGVLQLDACCMCRVLQVWHFAVLHEVMSGHANASCIIVLTVLQLLSDAPLCYLAPSVHVHLQRTLTAQRLLQRRRSWRGGRSLTRRWRRRARETRRGRATESANVPRGQVRGLTVQSCYRENCSVGDCCVHTGTLRMPFFQQAV